MTDYVSEYLRVAVGVLEQIARESADSIHRAAEVVADAIQQDHDFLVYGSGHSALIARDATGRAGGLVPAMHIHDIADGDAERLEGVAKVILAHYELRPGSVICIISNSGINAVPVEMAMMCKDLGLTVIAVTSLSHSRQFGSRHSSGRKLYEMADIVLDTHAIPGDAAVTLPGASTKSGATSTVAGSAILQALTVQVAGLLAERGVDPPLFISANVEGNEGHNAKMLEHYWSRLVRHEMAKRRP